ncbi:MAG TPA: sigma-70 family RNA polymerase sigma factor [Gemmata sp.]|nr:sigma-70 family RNA polymerase sigma factor [Gemmata sp.]
MPYPALSAALARASRSVHPSPESEATDGGLLTRFIQTKDETAFAELVRRLGPMVLGVCRRITGDSHLAEDAFQAAFIVLAQRANDVRPREELRGWLYGVAVRTAKRARAVSIHHRAHEIAVPALPDRPVELAESPDTDAIRVLDEEVGALPELLRIAVVLCELEGQSRKEVAGKLRIPEGTLSSRLAAARKRLAERLHQRGIILSAAGLSAALAQLASAQPSGALVARAAIAAIRETIPAHVAALSQGVLRIMFLDKLRTSIPLALVVAGLLTCGAVAVALSQPPAIPPRAQIAKSLLFIATPTDPPSAKVEPKPLPKGPNKLLLYRTGYLTMMDPDGKNEKKVSEDRGKFHFAYGQLSPDGKMLATLTLTQAENRDPKLTLHVRELDDKDPGTDLGITCRYFTWSPDGSQIAATDVVVEPNLKFVHHLVDVKTKEKKKLKLPRNHLITDWTRDGKYFLTTAVTEKDGKRSTRIHLMNMDGTEHKVLTNEKEGSAGGRISPDGTRVLCAYQPTPAPSSMELCVLVVDTGKTISVRDFPPIENGALMGFCWSPDGKRIAYAWKEKQDGKPADLTSKETESHLTICDPDGKNPKIIVSEKAESPWIISIGQVDWR